MKILFLVLFFLFTSLSCKQNPRSMLSSPPIVDDKITNNNTGSSNTNSGSNNDLNSGYGRYDVYILGDNGTIITNQYKISDTDKLLKAYSNMIIDSIGKPRFELSKNSNPQGATMETYTFDANLDLKVKVNKSAAGAITARNKQFIGVCLVIIYPDATDATAAATTANSSLLGKYTIAGIYREENSTAGSAVTRAMKKSEQFQNPEFDELIILRTDVATTNNNNINYRADILFNDDKWISLYNYDPDRTFEKQNTNFIFKRATTQQ